MDEKFDKLIDCPVADMKNITGTRGAWEVLQLHNFLKDLLEIQAGLTLILQE